MKMLTSLFIIVNLLCLPLAAKADEALQQFTLKNGLHVIVKVDKRAPVAVFQVWYKVGSSYESNGATGIAHLTEHMMFDGTPRYPKGALTSLLTFNGAAFNAFTDRDYTAYYEELAVTHLPLAFELEADRMAHLSLTPEQFNKEINVVREERRLRTDDQPAQIALERFLAAAYISSPYHHPVVGWMDDLNHMNVGKVRQWYENWYAPNNATLVIVGDVDPKHILQLANTYFGPLKARTLPNVPATTEIPTLGKRTVTVKIPAQVSMLFVGYNVPSLNTADDPTEVYALDVLSGVLSGDNSSRFARELIRGDDVATSASADYDAFSRLSTLFILSGVPTKKEGLVELHKAFNQQIELLQTKLINDSELQRVKAQIIANDVYTHDSIVDQATKIGALVSVGLPLDTVDTYIQHINLVTAEQIRAVARKYLTPDNATETVLKPLPMSATNQENSNSAPTLSGTLH